MTDLTEQWKKGELPEGHYYVKDGENMIAEYLDGYFYNNGEPMTSFSGGVDEILAPVPSYEEWKNFVDANTSLFDAVKMLEKDNFNLEKQNAQLKELLEWCRDELFEVYSNEVHETSELLEVQDGNTSKN